MLPGVMPGVLILALHLVVARDDGGVARRRGAVAAALAVLLLLLLLGGGRGGRGAGGAVVGVGVLALGLGMGLALGLAVDEDVGDAAGFAVLVDRLVLVGRLGEFGDDVPGVDEAGDLEPGVLVEVVSPAVRVGGTGTYIAEDEEEDVDEGVGGADAALHPDCAIVSDVVLGE